MTLRDKVMRVVRVMRAGYCAPASGGYAIELVSSAHSYLNDMKEYVHSTGLVRLQRYGAREIELEHFAHEVLASAMEVFAYKTTPQTVIPPGYTLVPVEPTEEMIDLARSQSSFPEGVWRVMLAAAPKYNDGNNSDA